MLRFIYFYFDQKMGGSFVGKGVARGGIIEIFAPYPAFGGTSPVNGGRSQNYRKTRSAPACGGSGRAKQDRRGHLKKQPFGCLCRLF
ncbi:hypothetical protein B0187_06685 [Haemophilus paracuniculus]|uniref:Uncharacterized protein n=1 Tax=Haemophilus paracuniculus TaxID=734 RepID=A0A1T0ART3_9PAST|nr:hypothetical protein B0187_06685 [Haemophilus paracuniculus]